MLSEVQRRANLEGEGRRCCVAPVISVLALDNSGINMAPVAFTSDPSSLFAVEEAIIMVLRVEANNCKCYARVTYIDQKKICGRK